MVSAHGARQSGLTGAACRHAGPTEFGDPGPAGAQQYAGGVRRPLYLARLGPKVCAKHTVVIRHALRNALIPAVTVMGLQFGGLISGAVITETIFARVGLGRMYVESILNKDITMIQGLTLVLALMIMLINILVDLSYAFLDPRIRYE